MAASRLITYFVGEDVSMQSTMNEINGGLTNTGRRLDELGRRGGQNISGLSREFDRFKRHFGYATAGLATYEIFNAIGRLRDYQNEVAQLNATLNATPSQLQSFSRAAFDISTRTGTALDDVFQSMQNIINSFPQMSEAMRASFVPQVAMIEAMGARVSGVDPRTFGGIVSGVADAFYGRGQIARQGAPLIDRVAREIVEVQRRIPNPYGQQQFMTSIPTLAQGAVTAGFSLEQALALYTIAQRQLVNPRTTAQYMRQLFTRLHTPTRQSQPFFREANIGNDELSNLSGSQILTRLMQYGLSLPGGISAEGATQEQVAEFMRRPSWNLNRVSGASMQFFRQSIGGRIQSGVAMAALLRNLGQLPMEQQAIRNAPSIQSRMDRMDISMSQAGQAFSNITTELSTTLLPAINPLAHAMVGMEGIVNISTDALNRARNTINQHTRGIPIVGGRVGGIAEIGAIIAAIGIGRFAAQRGAGLIRGFRNRAEVPLQAERTLMEAEAAGNALAGVARGTPAAPFWVVIHPLSMTQIPALAGKGGFGGPGGSGNPLHDPVTDYFGFKAARGLGRRLGGRFGRTALGRVFRNPEFDMAWMDEAPGLATRLGLRGLPLVGPAYQFFQTGNHTSYLPTGQGNVRLNLGGGYYRNVPANSLAAVFMQHMGGNIPRGLQRYENRFASGQLSEQGFERAIANYINNNMPRAGGRLTHVQTAIAGMFRLGPGHQLRLSHVNRAGAANGYVEATLTLEPTQEFRNLLHPQQVRVHVPISELPAPTSRARTRVPRVGR